MYLNKLLLSVTGAGIAQKNDSLFMTAAVAKVLHSKEYTLQIARLMPENKYDFKQLKLR